MIRIWILRALGFLQAMILSLLALLPHEQQNQVLRELSHKRQGEGNSTLLQWLGFYKDKSSQKNVLQQLSEFDEKDGQSNTRLTRGYTEQGFESLKRRKHRKKAQRKQSEAHATKMLSNGSNKQGVVRVNTTKMFVHLDYLRVYGDRFSEKEFLQLLSFIDNKYMSINPENSWSCGANARRYEMKIESPSGIVGGCTRKELESGAIVYDVMIQMSGIYFSDKSIKNQWRLLVGLYSRWRLKCTRIDIAIDDKTYGLIPLKQMKKAVNKKNHYGFRKVGETFKGDSFLEREKRKTATTNFGSRESGKYCRVYNHKDKCLRYEVEYKQEYAQLVYESIANLQRTHDVIGDGGSEYKFDEAINSLTPAKLPGIEFIKSISDGIVSKFKCWSRLIASFMGSIAVGMMDFRERCKHKNQKKASKRDVPRLAFWQTFIDLIGGSLSVKVPRKESSLIDTMVWRYKQCVKQEFIQKQGLGAIEYQNYLLVMEQKIKEKMTDSDWKKVEWLRDNSTAWKLAI